MNRVQIDRLLARVPANLDPGRRRRVDGYALTSRRCHEQLGALRSDLDRAMLAVDEQAAAGAGANAAADHALRLACEIETLERVQPRVDARLRAAVAELSDHPGPEPFGEGPA
jgi:hypothetical protein